MSKEGQKEREKQTPAEQGAWCGAPTPDPEVMTWAEGRHLTDWTTQALKTLPFSHSTTHDIPASDYHISFAEVTIASFNEFLPQMFLAHDSARPTYIYLSKSHGQGCW